MLESPTYTIKEVVKAIQKLGLGEDTFAALTVIFKIECKTMTFLK